MGDSREALVEALVTERFRPGRLPNPNAPKPVRGICPSCGNEYSLTRFGNLRAHYDRGSRCTGSGQAPRRAAT